MIESPRQLMQARLETLAAALRDAAQQSSRPEAIHALRVATRRFAQCLRVFEGQFDARAARKIRRRMRKWMDRCGAARNCDITLRLLDRAGISQRSAAARHVRRLREEARDALRKHLARARGRDIGQKWAARLFSEPGPAAYAPPDLARLTMELFAEGDAAAAKDSTYEQMHAFRLLAKRYRYTVELLGGEAAGPVLVALRKLQNTLGAMNDCVTALELIRGYRSAEEAVRAMLRTRETAFRRLWAKEFGKRRLREWTSIFSATAKQNPVEGASRKGPGRSRPEAAGMSAAS